MSDDRPAAVRALDRLSVAVMLAAGAALTAMSLIQAWQVFARYVLNASPGWTEPTALVLMSFAVMFGAAIGVRWESHFAFTTLRDAAPESFARMLKILSRGIAAATGLGLMILGGWLTIDDWGVSMAGAPLPAGLRFAALAIGGALIFVFAVERLITGDPHTERRD